MGEHRTVDARGSFCPGPLMELIAAMKQIRIDDTIELLSTDTGSVADVPEWVRKVGHEMGATEQDADGTWHLHVRKRK